MTQKLAQVYDELGGEEGIQKVLTQFYQKMAGDILVGFFFVNKDLNRIVNQQKSFLLKAMGKIQDYEGKTPKFAHTKLPPILKGHFDRRLVLLRETLIENHVSQSGIEVWIEFENQFRNVIQKK